MKCINIYVHLYTHYTQLYPIITIIICKIIIVICVYCLVCEFFKYNLVIGLADQSAIYNTSKHNFMRVA